VAFFGENEKASCRELRATRNELQDKFRKTSNFLLQ
jgi:hypothetical protein